MIASPALSHRMIASFSDPARGFLPARTLASPARQSCAARLLFKASPRLDGLAAATSDLGPRALPVPREGRTGTYSRPRLRWGVLALPALSDGQGGECLRPRSVASSAACIMAGTGGG